jgi:hypothetical protein
MPLGPVDMLAAERAMAQVGAEGGTPLGQFMKVGADELLIRRARNHYGTFRLLIVTDGEATDPDLVDAYLPDILSRGLNVDVIGVDMPATHSLATRVHTYRKADDANSLVQAVNEAIAETGDNRTDVKETDFELVQAIPEEMAGGLLTALAESGNHPIGEIVGEVDGAKEVQGVPPGQGVRRERRISLATLLILIFLALMFSKSLLRILRGRHH